jgi:hypothetical protein
MVKISVCETPFSCPYCDEKFTSANKTKSCKKTHEEALAKVLPHYRIGKHIETERYRNTDFGKETVVIVKTIGSLSEKKLLVEAEDGERWWVNAVWYHTSNLRHNPADFRFIPLLD